MKALSDDCERFISFPPGHIYSSKAGLFLPSQYNKKFKTKKFLKKNCLFLDPFPHLYLLRILGIMFWILAVVMLTE